MSNEKVTLKEGHAERHLSFSLGEESFAIPLLDVREVIAMTETTPIPFAPPHFLGIMNLRGQIISVIDLRKKMGVKPNQSTENAIIICNLQSVVLGMVVDSVDSVLNVKSTDISDKPEIDGSKKTEFITGVYRQEKKLVLFLDIAKALSLDDQKAIAKATADKKVA